MTTFFTFIIAIVIALIASNVRVVQQSKAYVIERLGTYADTWRAGMHIKTPFLDKVVKVVSLKEQIADFPPQPVITKDNVTIQIDTVVYYQVTDPKMYTYGIEKPVIAIENLTATTLRNLVGELDFDACLTSRDIVNTKMRAILDEATDPWGIKVNRVELKNIMPPAEIQNAMERQMKAERQRREAVTRADGEKQAAILAAQGEKEAAILKAEAQKIQLVREAEGHAESIRLHKEAEAAGIKATAQARAEGVALLLKAGLSKEQVVQYAAMDAMTKVADGQATKIIIPSELQGMVGLATGVASAIDGKSESNKPPVKKTLYKDPNIMTD